MIDTNSGAIEREEVESRSRFGDFVELTKPRLTLLSVMTTLAGFYMGSTGPLDLALLAHTLLGTFLVGGGCGALNMVIEREHDKRMRRTMKRPLPAGRLMPNEALIFGAAISIAGLVYLAVAVNLLTSFLAALTLISYLFLYTPMKRRTSFNTVIGAVPGALPPVIGWAAVRGSLGPEALALFAILFFWQVPHFLALAWMCREDYGRAGYKMLTVDDENGVRTGRHILLYTAVMLPVSLIPTIIGITGLVYFFGAMALGILFLYYCIRLALNKKNSSAKQVFYFSLLYLPALFLVMALDRGPL
jgi:protoheme IX farnesyltransferase